MSDRTDQLVDLKKILTTRYKIPPKKVGFYVGALTYKDKKRTLTSEYRQRVADTCEILLATFGMMQLGTDIPDLAGMVIATPQSSIVQPIGRIERKCDGKKQPIIIDIVDTFYKDSLYWGRAREKVYRRRNLEIVRKG
jgi:superfamily II DNA or RNA helicase